MLYLASVAQSAARQSHNLKAVSSSLTRGKSLLLHMKQPSYLVRLFLPFCALGDVPDTVQRSIDLRASRAQEGPFGAHREVVVVVLGVVFVGLLVVRRSVVLRRIEKRFFVVLFERRRERATAVGGVITATVLY